MAAAAAAAALVAGGITVAAAQRSADDPVASRPGPSPGPVVRDGDQVRGEGQILAVPGRPVRLCLPEPILRQGGPPSPPRCRRGIPVTGLDLDRLSGRAERAGTVWGGTTLEGVYRGGVVAVTEQAVLPPSQEPSGRDDPAAADPVPCPEPAGGWPRLSERVRTTGYVSLTRIVSRDAARLNDPYVAYPYGWHLQDQSDRKGTEILVVGTTGDLAVARRQLTAVFPAESLCVTRVRWSKAAMQDAERRLAAPEAQRLGFDRVSTLVLDDRVSVALLVLDEPAARFLAGIADGRVVPEPMLTKLP